MLPSACRGARDRVQLALKKKTASSDAACHFVVNRDFEDQLHERFPSAHAFYLRRGGLVAAVQRVLGLPETPLQQRKPYRVGAIFGFRRRNGGSSSSSA